MEATLVGCNCDSVVEMEEMAIGVEEIAQYARSVLPHSDVEDLIGRLECSLAAAEPCVPVEL